MDNFRAIMIAEGVEQVLSEATYIDAWQHLVDTGLAWRLQGWFGRQAASMIEAGLISRKGDS